MQKRSLGRSGINIGPLVFGGNVFGWTADEATSFALLDRFVEHGFNAIDTADVYSNWGEGLSGGESETVIGNWLARRGRRDDVVVVTKVGLWDRRKGLGAANIEAAVEESLQRLRTDYIDVYLAHTDDHDTPLEETLEAFERLVRAGKVRAIGASNYTAERLREALDLSAQKQLASYSVLQPNYNLYDRADFEASLAPLASERELGVISYFSLASGFLTGKYRSKEDLKGSAREAFLQRYFDDRGLRILGALNEVAGELSAKPAQIAIAWLLTRPALTAPIASATSIAQLDELLEATRLQLPEAAINKLNEASA